EVQGIGLIHEQPRQFAVLFPVLPYGEVVPQHFGGDLHHHKRVAYLVRHACCHLSQRGELGGKGQLLGKLGELILADEELAAHVVERHCKLAELVLPSELERWVEVSAGNVGDPLQDGLESAEESTLVESDAGHKGHAQDEKGGEQRNEIVAVDLPGGFGGVHHAVDGCPRETEASEVHGAHNVLRRLHDAARRPRVAG